MQVDGSGCPNSAAPHHEQRTSTSRFQRPRAALTAQLSVSDALRTAAVRVRGAWDPLKCRCTKAVLPSNGGSQVVPISFLSSAHASCKIIVLPLLLSAGTQPSPTVHHPESKASGGPPSPNSLDSHNQSHGNKCSGALNAVPARKTIIQAGNMDCCSFRGHCFGGRRCQRGVGLLAPHGAAAYRALSSLHASPARHVDEVLPANDVVDKADGQRGEVGDLGDAPRDRLREGRGGERARMNAECAASHRQAVHMPGLIQAGRHRTIAGAGLHPVQDGAAGVLAPVQAAKQRWRGGCRAGSRPSTPTSSTMRSSPNTTW